jgi:hypothetical protein
MAFFTPPAGLPGSLVMLAPSSNGPDASDDWVLSH